jgi:hypothetical protein
MVAAVGLDSSSHAAGAGDDNLNGQKSVRRTLTNLPAQAINCGDGDRAARSSRRRSASRVTTLQQLLPENVALWSRQRARTVGELLQPFSPVPRTGRRLALPIWLVQRTLPDQIVCRNRRP